MLNRIKRTKLLKAKKFIAIKFDECEDAGHKEQMSMFLWDGVRSRFAILHTPLKIVTVKFESGMSSIILLM